MAPLSYFQRLQAAESSMSDEDLANILEEMGKITKRWNTDRNQLVTDLTKARHESEEMKTLALTACKEASSVVQRAKAQAQSRLEAKKKVKAENKVLSQKNLALIKTCTGACAYMYIYINIYIYPSIFVCKCSYNSHAHTFHARHLTETP